MEHAAFPGGFVAFPERVDGAPLADRIVRVAAGGTILVSSAYMWTVLWLLLWSLVPMLFGLQPLTVHSNSMAPGLRTGDIVGITRHPAAEVEAVDERLEVSDVIAFRSGGTGLLTLHRIVEITDDGYRTKGDANAASDSGVVRPEHIDGVARLMVPSAGWPAHWAATGQWHLLLLLVVSLPLAYVGQRSTAPPEAPGAAAPAPAKGSQ